MKKLFITLPILLIVLFSTSCGRNNNIEPYVVTDIPTSLDGVVINGVRWATRNVDAPGTFADNPEDTGMFFQWNRKKGWNATNRRIRGWDNSTPEGTEWYAENDPCPPGWRVPTPEDIQSLKRAGSIWATLNGVNGRLFGTTPNLIFVPAKGLRSRRDSRLTAVNVWGGYWSNSPNAPWVNHDAIALWISDYDIHSDATSVGNRADGFNIRCVAKK